MIIYSNGISNFANVHRSQLWVLLPSEVLQEGQVNLQYY